MWWWSDSEDDLVVLDAASAVNLSNFKNAVCGIVEEYFNSGDIPEASRCLSVRLSLVTTTIAFSV